MSCVVVTLDVKHSTGKVQHVKAQVCVVEHIHAAQRVLKQMA